MVEMVPAGEAIACQLITLRRVIDQLELKFSQLAAEFDQTDWWDYEGFNSSGDWIRFNCRMTSNAAYDRLAVGERLAELPMSVDYLRDGEIGYSHLSVMARTAEAVGKRFAERELLPLALELTPGKFYYKTLHYRHSVDAKKYAEEQNEQQFSHHLSLSTAESGHLLLSQESLVMDVGRAKPIVSSSLRRALQVRDGHCRWPGCERTASKCDGHRLVHWVNGGPTELDNLVLLCRRHHRMVHEGGWQLIKCDDGQIVTIAPTVTFGLPRGPD